MYCHPNVFPGQDVIIEHGAVVGRMPTPRRNFNHPVVTERLPVCIGNNTVIGSNAVVYHGVTIGQNVVVCDLSSIREGCVIGDDSVIGRGAMVNYDSKIGSRVRVMDLCHIAGGTVIEDDVFFSIGACTTQDEEIYLSRFGIVPTRFVPPIIRKKALIGANAVILPGVEIGEGAIVGAGSVVTQDVLPYTWVMGNPARSYGAIPEEKADLVRSENWLK